MNNAESIRVPLIRTFGDGSYEDFRHIMQNEAAEGKIGTVNWPESFPYAPECSFRIARTADSIAIFYHVHGLDLRAIAVEDNDRVWEDSCCEFFVADPSDGTYYNFELNCIGTLLSANGKDRSSRPRRTREELDTVIRFADFPREVIESENTIHDWNVGMIIPFSMMGVDPDNLPSSLKANFYKCGDKTAHPHFLSWNPVLTPKPDFHRPEFFGTLIFE